MGFAGVFLTLRDQVLSDALGFITDILPYVGAVVGIALAGFALTQIRKFVG